ncbi:MAG: ATP-dependent DNA helicase RecG [Spirochaetaceae bacterium]|jgi:ATP-dependent DNA helicase RecG|nr:ATP-dependent DNA helicase RecG [Spirochaetaceae bacterium]
MLLRELPGTFKLSEVKGAGPKTAALLVKLDISNIADLLTHYPREYEDRTVITPLADYFKKKNIFAEAVVLRKEWFGFGRQRTLKVYIEDSSARASLVCFGRSAYLDKIIETSDKIKVFGHFYYKYGELQSSSFDLSSHQDAANGRALLPVYPLTEGLTQNTLRRLIQNALALCAEKVDDEIPAAVIEREHFPHKKDALVSVHFPKTEEEAHKARESLIYEELYKLQLALMRRAAARKKDAAPPARKSAHTLQHRLRERLPFRLTEGQEAAVGEINADIASGIPMERLLQGDVGSGKTLVSFMAALEIIEASGTGGTAALMAPTELLARQHAENAAVLLEPLGVRVAFLTGNIVSKSRRNLLAALSSGDIDLVVGTHALFSDDVKYKNLRLVIIDEQHRFGIEQRQSIVRKGAEKPHLLMMSATPIPRTLALTAFGDWDVSVIKGMPHGRLPIETHLARESNAAKVYEAVRKELHKGHQAYFVYPLIEKKEETEKKGETLSASLYAADLKDCTGAYEDLSKRVFPEYPIALLHSQIDEEEKRLIMERFRKGETAVLVATSVVEVGVDVPNATCMVIEHAERFGLSALHQLRGRVGRGPAQSYCFLMYIDNYTEEMRDRLLIMHKSNDGFVIAEEDLKIRGPGQILGTGQSGFMKLGLADPVRDTAILKKAREDAYTAAFERPPK